MLDIASVYVILTYREEETMYVTGYRAGANFDQARIAISKHTHFNLSESKTICDAIQEGQAVKLPDDFVLREDLEDLGIKVK